MREAPEGRAAAAVQACCVAQARARRLRSTQQHHVQRQSARSIQLPVLLPPQRCDRSVSKQQRRSRLHAAQPAWLESLYNRVKCAASSSARGAHARAAAAAAFTLWMSRARMVRVRAMAIAARGELLAHFGALADASSAFGNGVAIWDGFSALRMRD